jgi:uncharacterized protein (TIGR00297 family)
MEQLLEERQAKNQREERLRWQSQLLLAFVLACSVIGLAVLIWRSPTTATAEGVAVCAAFALFVWLLKAATPPAAVTGFVLTSCMYLATVEQPYGGWFHTALLPGLALFVLAFAATRFRRTQKEKSGLAESRRGRGASQVAANMGTAALAGLALELTLDGPGKTLLGIALIAALAEASADTVSSEIGQALGGRPLLLAGLRRMPPGTDGAISFAGTAASCLAAAILTAVAIPTLGLNLGGAAVAWVAAILGCFADSLIGATLERGGWINNDLVNFISTAVAALLALAAQHWLYG